MQHYYKQVPGWAAFERLYVEMVRKAPADRPSIFVEIGSWLGRSASLMGVEIINSRKAIQLHCIDPWMDGGPDLRDTKYFAELEGASPYKLFIQNTQPVRDVITAHRRMSTEAAPLFSDASVDFLMIDGDHSYEAVKADIEAWLPKMKKGSRISGDDYLWPGVKQAAEEAFGHKLATQIVKHHHNVLNSASYWWVDL